VWPVSGKEREIDRGVHHIFPYSFFSVPSSSTNPQVFSGQVACSSRLSNGGITRAIL
jgi:hypothetical protein